MSTLVGGGLPMEAFIMKHLKRCSGTILIGDSSPGLMKPPPAASWAALRRPWRLTKSNANSKWGGNSWRGSCPVDLCSWTLQWAVLWLQREKGLSLPKQQGAEWYNYLVKTGVWRHQFLLNKRMGVQNWTIHFRLRKPFLLLGWFFLFFFLNDLRHYLNCPLPIKFPFSLVERLLI